MFHKSLTFGASNTLDFSEKDVNFSAMECKFAYSLYTPSICLSFGSFCYSRWEDYLEDCSLLATPFFLRSPVVVLRMVGAIPDCQIAGSTSLTPKWPFPLLRSPTGPPDQFG